ncbi:MAG: aldolase/citrate lyase family protein [Caldilineaceae bacterium]|nr:aldolase/citrate lyase family protein [Caldilineaceae bacterium]
MAKRVNRAIELLENGQPIYYVGAHTGHVLTHAQGREDAATWADYINVGMEHGSFDMGGLERYMEGMVEGGPTPSGHRTPTVIVEAPVEGTSADVVRYNGWQFRQILARGVHGILLCQAETPEAVAAFVEGCRYPINRIGVDAGLGVGRRGVGSEPTAAAIWGVDYADYLDKADPWPLNPEGELLLGLKIESAAALPRIEEILAVPGIGFAEMGPGDLSISLGYRHRPEPWPQEMQEASQRVKAACEANGVAFLQGASPENVAEQIDSGVRVVGGHNEETARIGRAYTNRQMPY